MQFQEDPWMDAVHERRGERDGTERMPATGVGRAPGAASAGTSTACASLSRPQDALSVWPKLGGGGRRRGGWFDFDSFPKAVTLLGFQVSHRALPRVTRSESNPILSS
ncbi:hypothetical protein ZWY2020_017045 [Hordeum vulgare]|nr:hypothetical protein ZWY2020_017045 [Hordeum vulgare]